MPRPRPTPPPQGRGLPGHLTLPVSSGTRCLLPLLHAAPEGSWGLTTAQRGEEAEPGPQGGLLEPWPTPDQLERPRPVWGGSGSEGPEMEDWAATAGPVGGRRGGEGKLLGQRYLFLFSFQI